MPINLKTSTVESREQRLGTLVSWDGSAFRLAHDANYGEVKGACGQPRRRLCEQSAPFSQSPGCSELVVHYDAACIRDAILIQHSPIGCATVQVAFNSFHRTLMSLHGLSPHNSHSMCTNLTEDDMVFGGIRKLEKTIRKAWERHHPRVIFISTSCATGIIGDDVDSLTSHLEEELGIPVIPLHCEGFRSKHFSSGFDITPHGILRQLVTPSQMRQEDLVNVVYLWGEDVFTPMLAELKLRPNLVIAAASIEQLQVMSSAAATVTMCYTLSYLSSALEQEFGVPEIKAPLPYGFDGTDAWLRELARVTHRKELAEAYIAKEHQRVQPQLEQLRKKLKGHKGFVATGGTFAHALIGVLRELGVDVESSIAYHHDLIYDSRDPRQDTLAHLVNTYGDMPNYTVSNYQQYQLLTALQRDKPDFAIIRHGGMAVLASRLGIPALPLADPDHVLGYQGMLNLGESILNILPNKVFYEDIARHSRLPYKASWLQETNPMALSQSEQEVSHE